MPNKRPSFNLRSGGWWDLQAILLGGSEPQEFNGPDSNLRGRKDKRPGTGRMEDAGAIETLRWYRERGMIDYVIYSYQTPIAYRTINVHGEPVWFVLGERYSATTSRHQGKVQTALHDVNWSARGARERESLNA